MDFGFTAIPAIAAICYVVAEILKATSLDTKWLPSICMICGGILGVVAMNVMPGYPGTDILTSIAIGIASGLAATGANQIYKQFTN